MKTWGLAAIGVGLVGLAIIVVSRGMSGAKHDQVSSPSSIASDAANRDPRESRGEQSQTHDSMRDANVGVTGSKQDSQSPESRATPGNMAQARVSGERKADPATPDKFELEDARTAIGRPFPVSPSVERDCMHASWPDAVCIATRDFLAELSKEPRNIPWARDQERRLEAGINALGPDKFTIRAIECRSTRCAVEVASTDVYVGEIEGDPDLERNLLPRIATFGVEKGPNGERICVTVFTFERR